MTSIPVTLDAALFDEVTDYLHNRSHYCHDDSAGVMLKEMMRLREAQEDNQDTHPIGGPGAAGAQSQGRNPEPAIQQPSSVTNPVGDQAGGDILN